MCGRTRSIACRARIFLPKSQPIASMKSSIERGCVVIAQSQVQLIVGRCCVLLVPTEAHAAGGSCSDLVKAVSQVDGRAVIEASGGVSLLTVGAIASTGVDIISVGALTHSASVLDIGLDVED